MANLSESAIFEPGIYKIETSDAVLGGSETAPANIQAKQLANRTKWLRDKIAAGGFNGFCATYNGNLNSLKATGFYYVTSTSSNKPESAAGMCIVMQQDNSAGFPWIIKQFWVGSHVYFRTMIEDDIPSVGLWTRLKEEDNAVGNVASFARTSAPPGWLKCNGAAVGRTTYAELFAIIGTTFGAGNGITTFNLPDFRAEFIRGLDDGRGIDTGRVMGSAQADEFKSHYHSLQRVIAGGGSSLDGYDLGNFVTGGSLGPITTKNVQDFGGPETRPRNVALLFCIKY